MKARPAEEENYIQQPRLLFNGIKEQQSPLVEEGQNCMKTFLFQANLQKIESFLQDSHYVTVV